MPDGLQLLPPEPGSTQRTITIPYFNANLVSNWHSLHCQNPIVAAEVMKKFTEMGNKGMSNFGVVKLEDKSIRGELKKKESTDALRGGG